MTIDPNLLTREVLLELAGMYMNAVSDIREIITPESVTAKLPKGLSPAGAFQWIADDHERLRQLLIKVAIRAEEATQAGGATLSQLG